MIGINSCRQMFIGSLLFFREYFFLIMKITAKPQRRNLDETNEEGFHYYFPILQTADDLVSHAACGKIVLSFFVTQMSGL